VLDMPEEDAPLETTVNYVDLTAELVSAYISNNSVRPADLGELIATVHQTLKGLGGPAEPVVERVEKPTPSQIKKSITPDGLISFVDGKTYQTLKRHLTGHGLDLHTYKERYGLPRDYPTVAPNYAARRSELAKSIGLGQTRSKAPEDAASEGEPTEAPKRRGRPPKAA
jgi:predicted transcriptional regulator